MRIKSYIRLYVIFLFYWLFHLQQLEGYKLSCAYSHVEKTRQWKAALKIEFIFKITRELGPLVIKPMEIKFVIIIKSKKRSKLFKCNMAAATRKLV